MTAPRACILVVEDNPLNLKLAKTLLELDGYEVVSASDADEALAKLEERVPQLVLLDIQLPGMDGVELTRKLRGDPRFASLTIVATTAYAMKGDDERFLAEGFDGYIPKPIEQGTFGREVEKYLGRSRAAPQPENPP